MPGSQCSSSRHVRSKPYGPVTARQVTRTTVSTHTSWRIAADRRSPVAAAARRSPGNQSATGDVPGRKDLVEIRVQVMNQLRSNLELAFPGVLGPPRQPHHAGFPAPIPHRSPRRVALTGTPGAVAPIGRLQRRHRRADAVPAPRRRGPRTLLQSRRRLAARSRPVWSPPSKR